MKIFYLFCIIYFGMLQVAHSQTFKLTGKIVDSDTKEAIAGVYVTVKNTADTTKTVTVVTNSTGIFSFSNLQMKNNYLLYGSFLGYSAVKQLVTSNASSKDLGILIMKQQANRIGEVIVKGDPPASVQKGDTTEMNAGAFKVNRDASAEDLIKKMPGVTVENGTLKAHGEEVKKVLVDGKAFFGDDPSVALKNLPAEVIDKVQVFSKLSEQSEMTGFDDGNSSKTINIITKQNRRNGLFGKASAGSDFNDKYLAGLSVNKFKGQQRFTLMGLANNINQQNFGAQDAVGGAGGGRNFTPNQQGITTTRSAGLNYSNSWGKKVNLTSSYFYNNTDNVLDKYTRSTNFINADSTIIYNETNNSANKNANHRINMRLELNLDTMNTIVITPRLSFQANHSNTFQYGINNLPDSSFVNSAWTDNHSNSSGNNISSEIVYRHKFNKVRRTFSIGINAGRSSSDSKYYNFFYNRRLPLGIDSIASNQFTDGNYSNYSLSSNFAYTEPFGTNGLVQLNYNISYSHNKNDKELFRLLSDGALTNRIDSLSNIYQNKYVTNRTGVAYRFRKQLVNFSLGVDYQRSDLNGNVDFPVKATVSKPFDNVLPNMLFMYRPSKQSNIRVNYRTSTNAPSITQLQNVIDNTNSLRLSVGNPNLIQEYSHNLMTHIMFSNPDKNTSFSLFLSGAFTKNPIGSQTFIATKDTIEMFGVKLRPGVQLTRPVNLDQSLSARSMINYSFPLKFIKSKLNLILGFNYSVLPGYVNVLLNKATTESVTSGLVLSSNISENVDFSISYTNTRSMVKNNTVSRNNTDYLYQSIGAKFNFIIGNGFVLSSDILGQYNSGLGAGYNQNYILWNGGIGKKFLKSKNAELKANVFDVLNQSKNISRTVTAQAISDMRFNTLRQYAMLTFTYTIRNFQESGGNRDQQQRDRPWGERPMGERSGGDRPPMGDRPGGDR